MIKLPSEVRLAEGRGGMRCLRVVSPLAEAEVYLHGAHVTHFQPRGHRPVLFLSGESRFASGAAIRGGVPVCFPWFGARASGLPGAPHGFARLHEWRLLEARTRPGAEVELVFELPLDAVDRSGWDYPAQVRYRVVISDTLRLSLEVTNLSSAAFTYEEALHTYLAVSDVRTVRLEGLAGTRYEDRIAPGVMQAGEAEPLRFTAETDRIYVDTRSTCTVHDPEWGRTLTIAKEHSRSTVVWNPWTAKAAAMPDFGDQEWPGMLCVETCNIRTHQVSLPPGGSHTLTALIRAETASSRSRSGAQQ